MKFQVTLLIVVSLLPSCYLNSDEDLPMNGLFFSLRGTIYRHNDSVFIEDIGPDVVNRELPGEALVCHTTNVNTKCCRSQDNDNMDPIGNWLYPNYSLVFGNSLAEERSLNNLFVRIGYKREVRLVKRGNVTALVGRYICKVPHEDGEMINASINIISRNTVSGTMPMPLTTSTTMTDGSISSEDSNGGTTQGSRPVSPSGFSTTAIISVIVILIIVVAIVVVIVLIILFYKLLSSRISLTEKNGTRHSPDVSEMYSLPDKSQKNMNFEDSTCDALNISEMYAVVDKHAKPKEEGTTYEAYDTPKVSEMYAVVNKTEKQKATELNDTVDAPNLADMYAVVDKTVKKKVNGSGEAPDSPNLQDMYAVVDKKAKKNRTLPERTSDQKISDVSYSIVDSSAIPKNTTKYI